jgi:hypothetical protein
MTTLTHRHHIIPRHAGGDDSPENLVELTVEEHAEAHRILWETHGRWQDYLAYESLLGRNTAEEARIKAVKSALTGKPKSAEHRAKMSAAAKGNKHRVGHVTVHTPETKAKISAAQKDHPRWTPEARAAVGERNKLMRWGTGVSKNRKAG